MSLRKAQGLRVRLPLSEVTVAAEDAERLEAFADLIADEVNVKRVDLTTDVDAHGRFELVVNARAAGPRLGKQVQEVIKAVKAGQWTQDEEGTSLCSGSLRRLRSRAACTCCPRSTPRDSLPPNLIRRRRCPAMRVWWC